MPFRPRHILAASLTAACLVAPSAAQADCGAAASARPASVSTASAVQATLCLLNTQRAKHHLPPLRENTKLERAARGHSHAAEEAVARARPAVRAGVVLREGPDGGLALAHQHALLAPGLEGVLGVGVRVAAVHPARQVHLDDVERALGRQHGALRLVDHVVRRRGDGVEGADHARLVPERS